MLVVIAPDKFAGTLTAAQAARAMADGWAGARPGDQLVLCPLSDGGPGFIEALHTSLGGTLLATTVTGPLGAPTPATILLDSGDSGESDDTGATAYLEAAQACGLHLVPTDQRDPERTTSAGVGELLLAAADAGARRIVLGLGGTGTSDGGEGALLAMGATRSGAPGEDVMDLTSVRERFAEIELVVATDVDAPLLGPRGAAHGYGPQKGADPAAVERLEERLRLLAHAVGRRPDGRAPGVILGAGAGGGLGFAVLALGATRVPGIDTVLTAAGIPEVVAGADLVLTGEGAFDWQSLQGKTVAGVAALALPTGVPVVVLAGRVEVGRREFGALGVSAAYGLVGSGEPPAEGGPDRHAEALAALAARAARTWGT